MPTSLQANSQGKAAGAHGRYLRLEAKTPQSPPLKLYEPEQTRTAHRLLKYLFGAPEAYPKTTRARLKGKGQSLLSQASASDR